VNGVVLSVEQPKGYPFFIYEDALLPLEGIKSNEIPLDRTVIVHNFFVTQAFAFYLSH